MSIGFPGFPPEAITFFRGLARNNNRDWFLPRKPLFEEKVKQPMRELVEALNAAFRDFAPEYATDPAKAIYRFYRDTRFSKDKTPYKQHIAASFPRQGAGAAGSAGFYCSVSHKEIGIGGGLYMPTPEALAAIRNHIADNADELRRILAARPLKSLFGELHGDQLTRIPKGYAKDHPAEDLLRYKQFFVYVERPADIATEPGLFPEIRKHFLAMAPLLEYLNKPLVLKGKKPRASTYLA